MLFCVLRVFRVLVYYGAGVGMRRPRASTRKSATGPPAGVRSIVNVVRPPRGMTLCYGATRRSPTTRPNASYSVTVTSTSTVSSGPVLLTDPLTV